MMEDLPIETKLLAVKRELEQVTADRDELREALKEIRSRFFIGHPVLPIIDKALAKSGEKPVEANPRVIG